MGLAVMFVMLVSSVCAYGINWLLVRLDIQFLRLICYIAVIASAVQLVEMVMKKFSPALFRALGIFLPLITTNCAILGLALFQTFREYNFLQMPGLQPRCRGRLHPGLVLDGRPARATGTGQRAQGQPGRGHDADAGGPAVTGLHGLRRPGGQSWLDYLIAMRAGAAAADGLDTGAAGESQLRRPASRVRSGQRGGRRLRQQLFLQRQGPVRTPRLSALLPFGLLLLLPWLARAEPMQQRATALEYLNQLRRDAGMNPFAWDSDLARAAAGHAAYLARNLELGHEQTAAKPGFTGASPGTRALRAGFGSNQVTENIHASLGAATGPREWVDNLFTGIYHRLRFLDFHVDRLGLALAREEFTTVVFVMANRAQAELCSDPSPASHTGSYYYGVCSDSERKIPAAHWERARAGVRQANPRLVVWPPDGAGGVLPVFAEETPDPLPEFEVSGNPPSIHFNPARFEAVELERFELFRTEDDSPVGPIRLMGAESDPNGLLGPLDFVLFPLQRLDWNTGYRVEVDYRSGETRGRVIWHFRTRDPGAPVLTLKANGETLSPPPGNQRFAVEVPAESGIAVIRNLRYRSSPGLGVRAHIYDVNTLMFELTGPRSEGLVEVRLSAGFGFRLKLESAATANTPRP